MKNKAPEHFHVPGLYQVELTGGILIDVLTIPFNKLQTAQLSTNVSETAME